jgi:serine/threonine protein kinase
VQPLGVGGTGETWLCKRNDTGQEEAVKVIRRGPVLKNLQRLLTNEITLQTELSEGHVNIVDMHEVRRMSCHRLVPMFRACPQASDPRASTAAHRSHCAFILPARPPHAAGARRARGRQRPRAALVRRRVALQGAAHHDGPLPLHGVHRSHVLLAATQLCLSMEYIACRCC